MSYLEKVTEMYNMVNRGQLLEAFDKYYHTDCVLVEATGEVRKGKASNMDFMKEHIESIKEHHGAGVEKITANETEKTTMVEAWVELTFKNGMRMKMEEVAVQQWDGDHIIHERFYYNMPAQN